MGKAIVTVCLIYMIRVSHGGLESRYLRVGQWRGQCQACARQLDAVEAEPGVAVQVQGLGRDMRQ